MRVADLLDLEWLLEHRARERANDREPPAIRPSARDAATAAMAAGRGVDPDSEVGRQTALRAWLDVERLRRDDLPGERIAAGLSRTGLVLSVVGVVFGALTASGLLAYDGSQPVNVLWFLAAFVGAQVLTLALGLVLLLGKRKPPLLPGVRRLAAQLQRFGRRKAEGGVRAGNGPRFASVERWLLFGAAQQFGIAFNAGAMLALVALVAASDLTFCWATTLQVDAEGAHRAVQGLAAPWSLLVDGLAPDAEVVAQSRWSRMQGAFMTEGVDQDRAEQLAGDWWPFLLACVLTYGVLPRLIAWALGNWRMRRTLRAIRFDDRESTAVVAALLAPSAGWDAPDPERVRGPAPAPAVAGGAAAEAAELSGSVLLVLWGALEAQPALGEEIARQFGLDCVGFAGAGGLDLDADERAEAAIAETAASRVVLACDAGQQPTKDVLGFLSRGLAARSAPDRWCTVLLLERPGGPAGTPSLALAGAQERDAWRRSLDALGDVRIAVAAAGDG